MTWATSSLRSSSRSCSALVAAAEADHLASQALADDLLEADEGAAADEEDVGGVDLKILLLRMLSPPLRRHVGDRSLEQLEQGLLHPFARHVAGDRDVLAGLADLVDFIDVNDALLGGGDVVVGRHHELEDQVLDVLAHVAGLGQGGGVADGERNVQPAGQGLGQGRLAAAGRADQENIALGNLDVLELGFGDLAAEHALVVIDDRDGQRLLHPLLADDVLVQVGHELAGRRQFLEPGILPLMLLEEAFTHPDAMGADVRDRPAHGHGNQCPSLDHWTGLGAVPSAEITQDGGPAPGTSSLRSSRLSLRIEVANLETNIVPHCWFFHQHDSQLPPSPSPS